MDAIAELEKYRQNWRRVRYENPVISNREIGTIRVSDPPFQFTKVVVYRRDPISNKQYRHGAEIGSSYTAKHRPRCLHLSLLNDEWGPLTFRRCPDCNEFLSGGAVVYLPMVLKYIRRPYDPKKPWTWQGSGCWKDKKHTKAPWQSEERDFHGEPAEVYVGGDAYVRLTDTRRDVIELDGAIAPEIEQRRLNLLWPLIKDSEYRAPHSKVREARNGGLSIAEMAKRFKVSERTINYRLAEIPDTIPPVNRNALQVAAGGGYTRPKFWPGADFIPRGSTESRPRDKTIPFGVGWFPVQPGPSTGAWGHNDHAPFKRFNDVAGGLKKGYQVFKPRNGILLLSPSVRHRYDDITQPIFDTGFRAKGTK
jgi:hypothetical protein